MNEYAAIKRIIGHFPRSASQQNQAFCCDAEIVEIGDSVWGISLDEFTPEEDMLTCEDAHVLGVNLAVATLSDLLAARCAPRFFMQSLSLGREVSPEFVDELSSGIASVLDLAGCFLIGGDLGGAGTWRFCGMAMGPVQHGEALTRVLPAIEHELWITGNLGDANLACFQQNASPQFELRLDLAEIMWQYGTACIDTSGGLIDALQTLERLNPQIRFDLSATQVPLVAGADELECMDIPREAVLMGQAGEYELLFALPSATPTEARKLFSGMGAARIGTAAPGCGVFLHRRDGTICHLQEPLPCPRNMELDVYTRRIIEMSRDIWE